MLSILPSSFVAFHDFMRPNVDGHETVFHSCLQRQPEKFSPVIIEPPFSKWIYPTTSRVSEYLRGPGDLSSGIISRERAAIHSNPCSANLKKESRCNSTAPIRLNDIRGVAEK